MKRLFSIAIAISIFLFNDLIASDIRLIEPSEAIRLIGKGGVLFISADSKECYERSHIIGSKHISVEDLRVVANHDIDRCKPLYLCFKDTKKLLEKEGIKNSSTIILYDNFWGSKASALYSFFESIGHEDIAILNGGLKAIKSIDPNQKLFDKLKDQLKSVSSSIKKAKKDGDIRDVESLQSDMDSLHAKMNIIKPNLLIEVGVEKENNTTNIEYKIDNKIININYLADNIELKKAVDDIAKYKKDSKFLIIDVRSMEEIIGSKLLDGVLRGGHIPNAIFLKSDNITDYAHQRSFRSQEELKRIFDKVGITKDKTIYLYSHYGAGRSSHVAMALRLLGYKKIKIFTGGWDSWGSDLNMPIRR